MARNGSVKAAGIKVNTEKKIDELEVVTAELTRQDCLLKKSTEH